MHTKNRTAVVTERAAGAALRGAATPALGADEERALRMRLGAPPPRTSRLERKVATGTDVELELLAYEIEAFMRWKAHLAAVRSAAAVAPRASRTKDKIVRALRRKS
jgi:hypothetical protein